MLDNDLYVEDVYACAESPFIDWEKLTGKTIAISGATGAVGSFLVDVLMRRRAVGQDISVLALGRSEVYARKRLGYFGCDGFRFTEIDVSKQGKQLDFEADFIFHLASATHPRLYASEPIATIEANIFGLSNLLERIASHEKEAALVFASSVEVYGQGRGDSKSFDEAYCGYIDCNTLRAGYPESKRLGEALCQAYAAERGIAVSIPRLPRLFGPTVKPDDSRAISQFIMSAVSGQDIVLKSDGKQLFSHLYIPDAVAGMLCCTTRGERGAAYNVCGLEPAWSLREIAEHLAALGDTQLNFELPKATETKGYSLRTSGVLDGRRLAALGFVPRFDIASALERTFRIYSSLR